MVLLWHVVTIAARLCCSAGIHQQNVRPSNLSEAQKRAHRWVFWTIYSVDHALSLNLMQPSNLPDWDMTIDIPTDPDPLWSQHWIWTKLAHVQGQVYENLYSPKARKSGTQSREQEAGRLAQEMLKIQELFEVSTLSVMYTVTDHKSARPCTNLSRTVSGSSHGDGRVHDFLHLDVDIQGRLSNLDDRRARAD